MRKKALLSKVLKSLKGAGITNYDLYLLNRGVVGAIPREGVLCRAYYDTGGWQQLRWPRQTRPTNEVDFILLSPSMGSSPLDQLRRLVAEKLVQIPKWPEPQLLKEI